ncbi:hybrid sensor histidine kinase/response regulator [uncultured Tolumonas sp.]|uniref:hybrid sensor histidine kinase/response regulator n=1 Tax=uncultured Tolumonas sp. TaxID=263765 RepID=UPI002A0A219B|nr:hybrid sensor histidine kinase/response regulator [uncultured Tolumonas sp.]
MESMDQELRARLLETFLIEAGEHVASINHALSALEQNQSPAGQLEIIFRCAHSLKGGARIVNLQLIEYLCQSLESLLSRLRQGDIAISQSLLNLLHEAIDIIDAILASSTPEMPSLAVKSACMQLRQQLDKATVESANISAPTDKTAKPYIAEPTVAAELPSETVATHMVTTLPEQHQPSTTVSDNPIPSAYSAPKNNTVQDTVRIPASRLDNLLVQAEEMMALKLALRQHVLGLKTLQENLNQLRREQANKTELNKDGMQQLDRTLLGLGKQLQHLKRHSEEGFRQAGGMIENLILDAKSLLMFPFSFVAEGFARSVRDIAREQGKEVTFQLSGETLELDRRILQELKDPLVHLLRNSIDHGIESPAVRIRNNKPQRATISLSAGYTDNGKAEIILSDDGAGINLPQIRQIAIDKGFITPEQSAQTDDQALIPLIFRSGFSSKQDVSHLSGRGLGLAIVQEKVEKLGGTIDVSSQAGEGTQFRLILPLTLASFRGIQIRLGEHRFAVPTLNVVRVLRLSLNHIYTVEGRETLQVEERIVPIVAMSGILGVQADPADLQEYRMLLLLGNEHEQIAFAVDEVIGEDDLLLKPLGPQLIRVRNLAGATLLGDGTVLPILNARDLLKSAQGGHAQPVKVHDIPIGKTEPIRHRILVVDDSITSRTLLKNVLESYGYEVKTAVDGTDALALLQTEPFDLVSSDVEMPQMDGFELTARLRADERFARLPIVLVTSLESQDDRQRGVEVGADAYIVKSSFDQSNLLEIIRKFI